MLQVTVNLRSLIKFTLINVWYNLKQIVTHNKLKQDSTYV